MRLQARLFAPPGAALALLLACAPGCQTTNPALAFGRPKVLPGVRTTTSIGDRPVSVVAGMPGESYALDTAPLPAHDSAEGRVSGRVVDERGRPVPNAEVRLADGSSPFGRSVQAVTDDSGGFTLRGLRHGRRYTLVAEADDGRTLLLGRNVVEAPDNDVRVRLAASEPRGHAAASDPDGRVDRVSERSEAEPEDEREPEPAPRRPSSRVNTDDLPPAAEAEALEPESGLRTAMTANPSRGWRSAGDEKFGGPEPSETDEGRLPDPSRSPRRRSVLGLPVEDDDGANPLPPALEREPSSGVTGADEGFGRADDRSGFPPADESQRSSFEFPSPPPSQPQPPAPAEPPSRPLEEPAPGHMPGELGAAASPIAEPRAPDTPAPASMPEPAGELSPPPAPESTAPDVSNAAGTASSPALHDPNAPAPIPDPMTPVPGPTPELPTSPDPAPAVPDEAPATPPAQSPPSETSSPEGISAPPAESGPALEPASEPEAGQADPPAEGQAAPPSETEPGPEAPPAEGGPDSTDHPIGSFDGPEAGAPAQGPSLPAGSDPAPRPTWSQLTAQSSLRRAMTYPPSMRRIPPDGSAQAQAAPTDAPRGRLGLGLLGNRRDQPAAPKDATADSGVVQATGTFDARRRVVDFTLPDVQGRPVRLQDLDADYILIDFWGTWCGPCLKSIPHLVQIQNRYDPKLLRVVGVAYEQGTPEENTTNVLRAMRQLAINYPVLMAEQDGRPCPLADALNVNGYPTLILLDRHGRLLWRQTGGSPSDLARLDRVVRVVASRGAEGKVRR